MLFLPIAIRARFGIGVQGMSEATAATMYREVAWRFAGSA
jgi:hypothetical protein